MKNIKLIAVFLSFCMAFQGFVFTSFAEEEATVEEVISLGFYSFSETIDVSGFGIDREELTGIVSKVMKDDPYLFYVDTRLSYTYEISGRVLSLKPTYNMSEDEVREGWNFCREAARGIAEMAMAYDSPEMRALFVHDYVCENFEYDATLESDDLLSFFVTGKGTCQGYAAAYIAALRECGISCHFVASDTIVHIWNLVEIDGEWYHVDLTWDDSSGERSRRHFLLSDRLAKERGHRDWYSACDISCESEKYADAEFDGWLASVHSPGDVDHDGKTGLSDLLYLRNNDLSDKSFALCLNCSDLDGDGEIGEEDVGFLRKKLLTVD